MSAFASTSSTSLDTDVCLTMRITLPPDPNLVNRLFPEEEFFLGPVFDEGSRKWVRYYLFENPESIKSTNQGLQRIIDSVDTDHVQAALTAVAKFGRAAGKIYIEFSSPFKIPNQWALSGFWLQGGFFVTCAHWYNEKELKSDSLRDVFIQMNSSETSSCYVSSNQGSKVKDVEEDQFVRLWDIDRRADIAIFVAVDPEPGVPKNFVKLDELSTLQPMSSQKMERVFTVAYASADVSFATKQGKEWLAVKQKENEARCDTILQHQRAPSSIFEYLLVSYLLNLKDTSLGRILRQKRGDAAEDTEYTHHDNIFWSNTRALAVGHTLVTSQPHNSDTEIMERRKHTISSFYGCSGGMIGVVQENGSVYTPKVVGLVAGGSWAEPNNSMRAFTSVGIQWLKNTVKSEGRKPTDFNKS